MDVTSRQQAPLLFLALFWSGREAKSVSEIIGAYDWINRLVIAKTELEDALGLLLASGLVEQVGLRFKVRDDAYAAFDTLLKKRKRDKFELAVSFLSRQPPIEEVTVGFELSENEYERCLAEYRAGIRASARKFTRRDV